MSVQTINQFTGKAGALLKLQEVGFNVPPFIVITEAMLKALTPNQIIKTITSKIGSSQKGAIEKNYYAVRSSANLEDGAKHSFAGIFHTELFVRKEELIEAIHKVIASANSEQLQSYCNIHKIDVNK